MFVFFSLYKSLMFTTHVGRLGKRLRAISN
jgi:hypothetical protein